MTVPLASAGIMVQDSGLLLRDLDDVGLVGLGWGSRFHLQSHSGLGLRIYTLKTYRSDCEAIKAHGNVIRRQVSECLGKCTVNQPGSCRSSRTPDLPDGLQ